MPVTKVKTGWDSGNFYYYADDGNVICYFDGTNRKLVFPSGAEIEVDGVNLFDELKALNGLDATELGFLNGVTAGTAVASKAAVLDANKDLDALALRSRILGAGNNYKLARGQHTTVAASDTVVTGLTTVVAAVAVLDSDPTTDPLFVTCSIGDQAGAPAAGSIYIKTWKPTANDNVTPIAATTFTKLVNWIAIGT